MSRPHYKFKYYPLQPLHAEVAERQTHTTQNRAGNHVGSNPTFGTKIKLNRILFDFFYWWDLASFTCSYKFNSYNPHSMFCTRGPVTFVPPEN